MKRISFLLAYADMYGLLNAPLIDVIELCSDFLASEEFVNKFLEKYYSMEEYKLKYEVKESLKSCDNFFQACEEWDI